MSLGFPVLPMKATMGSTGAVPDSDDWAFEIKWDGYRTIVHIVDGRVRLQSTAGHDVTDRWPEFAGLAEAVNAPSAILDGELVVFDDDGRPRFDLAQRSGVGADREAVIQLFDVLQIDDNDTIDLPYLDRRRLLDRLVEPGDNWTVPSFRLGDGAALLAATAEQGLEGVIAKRTDSRYRPGTRSKHWRKIKNRIAVDLTIGGFTAGTGNRVDTFGALLVGRPAAGGLAFAGGVGTGFDQRTLMELRSQLDTLSTERSPFDPPVPTGVARTATWVEPVLRATVEIAEFTNDGQVRHASFVELVRGDRPRGR
ncbi:MAG TPA: non-homologous end-joining DNA ligase [Ilumatobacteraceae bacterium]|nr:non-homologous end-joining DNA ligase [Ilumatobacteraceae bacterium]